MALVLNISPAELNAAGFPALIDQVLADGTIAPGQLRLDIAARRGLAEQPAFGRRLSELRERGIHLAFDGFTGDEASLAQFRGLPFHQIKLHEEIVSKALVSPAEKDYLRAVTGYCRSAGISVAAKGVETEQHLALALEVGCNEIQGRLLTRPTPDNGAGQWATE